MVKKENDLQLKAKEVKKSTSELKNKLIRSIDNEETKQEMKTKLNELYKGILERLDRLRLQYKNNYKKKEAKLLEEIKKYKEKAECNYILDTKLNYGGKK